VTLPITKHSYQVERVEDLPRVVAEAFHLARSGRPGPVLIDLPKTTIVAPTKPSGPVTVDMPGYRPTMNGNMGQIKTAAKLIAAAQRPVLMAGHGIYISGAMDELRQLAEKADLPVAFTLHGLGTLPERDRFHGDARTSARQPGDRRVRSADHGRRALR